MALVLLLKVGIFVNLCKMAPAEFPELIGKEETVSSVSTLRKRAVDSLSVEKTPACEYGWLNNGGYCYRLENHPMNWENAACRCLRKGGHLASIHSQEQQDFLTEYIIREVSIRLWIGLHDSGFEGDYVWEDGSNFDYINWSSGEPSGGSSEEDCVEMRHDVDVIGTWNDAPCKNEKAFICQKLTQKKNKTDDNNNSFGLLYASIFIITIIFVIALMAQMGWIFYYRRLWLEKHNIKLAPVVFQCKDRDNKSSTEVHLKNDDTYEEPKYVQLC